jgi:hypothetical protein
VSENRPAPCGEDKVGGLSRLTRILRVYRVEALMISALVLSTALSGSFLLAFGAQKAILWVLLRAIATQD